MARTVLIVEDNPTLRLLAHVVFEDAGYRIKSVERVDQAVSFLRERSEMTDLIFTDIQTPGELDGLELARLVKMYWPHVQVIVTSGLPMEDAALPHGVRYAQKPWQPNDVLDMAALALATRH